MILPSLKPIITVNRHVTTADLTVEWCRCGQQTVICQRCGQSVCGTQTSWFDGAGNICLVCDQLHHANHGAIR